MTWAYAGTETIGPDVYRVFTSGEATIKVTDLVVAAMSVRRSNSASCCPPTAATGRIGFVLNGVAAAINQAFLSGPPAT